MELSGTVRKFVSIIKIISFFLVTTIIFINCDAGSYMFFAFCIAGVIGNSYLREFYLYNIHPLQLYAKISTVIEIILISLIGIYDSSNAFQILFFASISELTLVYSLPFSISLTLMVLSSRGVIEGTTGAIVNLELGFSSLVKDVSIIFGYVMSLVIRMQVIEREKVLRINSEIEKAYKELMENYATNEELSLEKERLRIAREIHDTLAYTLTTVIIQTEVCKKLLEIDKSRAKEELEKAQSLIKEGLNDVKSTIKSLRPAEVENKSLFDIVINLTNDIKKNNNIQIILTKNLKDLNISQIAAIALLRIMKESITNAIRHGFADKVEIFLEVQNNKLVIKIHDNGKGCEYIKKGYGLRGITERVEEVKGVVDFSSSQGSGFTTILRIPLEGGNISAN